MDIRAIPFLMTRWFTACLAGLIVSVSVFCALAFGIQVFLSFFRTVLIVSPFMLLVAYMLFLRIRSGLVDVVERAMAGTVSGEDERFISRFSITGTLYIFFVNLAGFAAIALVAIKRGAILTGIQIAFLFIIAVILAAIMSALFFYKSRIALYYLGNRIKYKPLNVFQKFSVPIMSAILLLLTLASVGIYRMTYNQIYSMRTALIESGVNRNMFFIQDYFNSTLSELTAHAMNSDVRSMNPARIKPVIAELENKRDISKIEMYLVADGKGDAVINSLGRFNIGDRDYYKKVMSEGKPVFSDPVVNKATRKEIIVCAVPVFVNQKTAGVICSTILIETLDSLLSKDTITRTGRYMILDKEGKCIYHKNRGIVGKSISRDFPDDAKNRNIKNLVESAEGTLFGYRFNGIDVLAYKVNVPVLNCYLVFSMDKSDLLHELNFVMIEIIGALLLLSLVTFLLIYRLAMNFSMPISNMTVVIQKFADGDMTAESNDFLADEFGELIRNFKLFQNKLRDAIQQALFAAEQLSSSAEELAATSQSLSEGAQTQAASVEEASASIEEVSGAVELINNNAGDQAALAKATFGSMDRLKSDNETVVDYAGQALNAARKTTEQANTGQRLMENTITGMNNIDESTKKIAETVRLISDISDQVNLLALNASIEAARAGEHGKGFAVVAEEISKLADETASSAKNISGLVKTGLQEVNKGREYVDATSSALNNIIGFIKQTEGLVGKITESAERQARSSGAVLADIRKVMEMADSISSSTNEQMMTNLEMSKTMEQINQNTQAAAAASEQIASSAEEISSQAESLRSQMQFFKV